MNIACKAANGPLCKQLLKKRNRKKEITTRAWEMEVGSSMDSDLSHE